MLSNHARDQLRPDYPTFPVFRTGFPEKIAKHGTNGSVLGCNNCLAPLVIIHTQRPVEGAQVILVMSPTGDR